MWQEHSLQHISAFKVSLVSFFKVKMAYGYSIISFFYIQKPYDYHATKILLNALFNTDDMFLPLKLAILIHLLLIWLMHNYCMGLWRNEANQAWYIDSFKLKLLRNNTLLSLWYQTKDKILPAQNNRFVPMWRIQGNISSSKWPCILEWNLIPVDMKEEKQNLQHT